MNKEETVNFCNKNIVDNVASISVSELVACINDGKDRLKLPPIQRSAVWTNAQIINFWDSLLRGYPAGMMFINKAKKPMSPAE